MSLKPLKDMDYVTDLVRIDPRLADFWMVTDDCPSEALHGFMTDGLAAVDP